jgi:hypothetical protein
MAANEPVRPDGARFDFVSLCLATDAQLEVVMRQSTRPDPARLAGWELRGWNTLDLTAVLGFRKFKKGFYQEDPAADPQVGVQGYNVKVVQNGLGDAWFDRVRQGTSLKHGWFEAYPVRLTDVDCRYPDALLINYDCDRNLGLDPARRLRDYLVQPYADDPDLYLGKAYVALLGPLRRFVSYFVLERYNESTL